MRSQAKAVYVLGSCLHGWCQAFHKQQEKAPGHVMGEEVGSPQLQSGGSIGDSCRCSLIRQDR